MERITFVLGIIGLVFGSLIAFPAHLHWMVSLWVMTSLVAFARGKALWPWLLGAIFILALKRPGFTIEFWVLVFVFLSVAAWDWRCQFSGKTITVDIGMLCLFALILGAAVATYRFKRIEAATVSTQIELDGRPIACLGDSLTDYGYPQELEKLITVPVADFGRNGITTDDGIEMIPEILAANPQLVVIVLGGHDYNSDKKTKAETQLRLEILITRFLQENIAVVLVEIPRGFVSDPYDGLERELADKYDLELIDDTLIRSLVFYSPIVPPGMWLKPDQRYSDDGLHPNQLGNRHFARTVQLALSKVFGDTILK